MHTGFDIFAAVFATNALPGGVAATRSQTVARSRTVPSRDNATTTDATAEDGLPEGSASLLPASAAARLQTSLDRAGSSSTGAIDGASRRKPKAQ